MKSYLTFEPGLPELEEFAPNCWVHVECPDEDDFLFLTKELGIPREFLSDIADIDERPRAEREDDWLLTILRIPMAAPARLHQSYPAQEHRDLQPDGVHHPDDLLLGGMVPEVPETHVPRDQSCREGARAEYP